MTAAVELVGQRTVGATVGTCAGSWSGVASAVSLVQRSWNNTLPSSRYCLVRQLQGAALVVATLGRGAWYTGAVGALVAVTTGTGAWYTGTGA